ncbi:MAG: sulfotransferase family 2 domain-containing protein [Pikeienuella sp.]
MSRAPVRYFAIFGAMRTGSNLLERSLNQFPGLTGLGELYNRRFIGKPTQKDLLGVNLAAREANPVGLLDKVLDANEGIIGFRIFGDHDPRMIDHAARDPSCAKFILTRDPVDSFISLKIANETGQWMLSKDENRRLARIRFEPEEFIAYRDRLRMHYAQVRHTIRASGGSAFEISYPELSDPDLISGAARFAGATAERPDTNPPILRQNPPDRSDKVENFEEMQAFLKSEGSAQAQVPQAPAMRYAALDEMIVGRKLNLIYAPIPGAAAAEVKRFLSEAEDVTEEGGIITGLKPLHVTRRKRRGGLVFTFVRHPATRLVDVFLRRLLEPKSRVFDDLGHLLTLSYQAPSAVEMRNDANAQKAGFDAFLTFIADSLAGRTAMRIDPSWAPQVDLLKAYGDKAPVDFIGRIESLTSDARYVLSRAGAENADALCTRLTTHLDRFSSSGAQGRLLTLATERRIYQLYARDYDGLGYSTLNKGAAE